MKVTNFTYLTFFCIFLIIYIYIIYSVKEKEKNKESKSFKKIIVVNFVGLILQTLAGIVSYNYDVIPNVLSEIIIKTYLIYFIIFGVLVLEYLVNYIEDNKIINFKFVSYLFYGLSLVTYFLPLKLNLDIKNLTVYSYGFATTYTYIIGGIVATLLIIMLFSNIKKLNKRKIMPVLLYLILTCISIIIQRINPSMMIMCYVETFLCFIMYTSISNPDAKIAEMEEKLKDAAIQASQAKSEFLSSMSHELRTPLNAIVGLSEDVASYKDEVPHDVREDSDDIINASNTLLELIGSILDISKIESGKLEIVDTFYSPKEEIESLSKIMRTKVAEKPLEFIVNIAPNIPQVLYGDRLRIKQIINNLLSNAIKYTASGTIRFDTGWVEATNTLTIRVADTGSGIKPENLNKLFGKYERLEVEKVSTVQGTGLGLAITKNLIELMGGEIKVDSVWGQGTTFSVTIPQKIGTLEELEKLKQLSTYNPVNIDFTGRRLLIVDDNQLNIKVLKKAIKRFNFVTDECYNGLECLNKIKAGEKYDLILLDNLMPVMNGEETIKNLRQIPDFKTPVIALTADAMTGAKEKYVGMGFDDYLAKPFTRESIVQKLGTVLSEHDVKVDNLTVNVNITSNATNNNMPNVTETTVTNNTLPNATEVAIANNNMPNVTETTIETNVVPNVETVNIESNTVNETTVLPQDINNGGNNNGQ